MKIKHCLAAAVLISTCAIFPAFAQDAMTQAAEYAQQYNEQMRQVATDNAEQARKSMSQNNNGGAIDLDQLFGLGPNPAPVVATPPETMPAPHRHRYRHRRKHVS